MTETEKDHKDSAMLSLLNLGGLPFCSRGLGPSICLSRGMLSLNLSMIKLLYILKTYIYISIYLAVCKPLDKWNIDIFINLHSTGCLLTDVMQLVYKILNE